MLRKPGNPCNARTSVCISYAVIRLRTNLLLFQGSDESLQLPAVNRYLRLLQHQHLGSKGSPESSGFVVEARPASGCIASYSLHYLKEIFVSAWRIVSIDLCTIIHRVQALLSLAYLRIHLRVCFVARRCARLPRWRHVLLQYQTRVA